MGPTKLRPVTYHHRFCPSPSGPMGAPAIANALLRRVPIFRNRPKSRPSELTRPPLEPAWPKHNESARPSPTSQLAGRPFLFLPSPHLLFLIPLPPELNYKPAHVPFLSHVGPTGCHNAHAKKTMFGGPPSKPKNPLDSQSQTIFSLILPSHFSSPTPNASRPPGQNDNCPGQWERAARAFPKIPRALKAPANGFSLLSLGPQVAALYESLPKERCRSILITENTILAALNKKTRNGINQPPMGVDPIFQSGPVICSWNHFVCIMLSLP